MTWSPLVAALTAVQVGPPTLVDVPVAGVPEQSGATPVLGYCNGAFLSIAGEVSPVGGPGGGSFARVRPSDGVQLDIPARPLGVAPGAYYFPEVPYGAIACDAKNALVLYPDTSDDPDPGAAYQNLRAARIQMSDGALVPNGEGNLVSTIVRGSGRRGASVSFGAGRFLAAWTDYRNGKADIYAAFIEPGTGLVADVPGRFPVSTAPDDQVLPFVSFGNGVFFVAWTDFRNGDADVYGARVRASDGMLLDGPAATGGVAVATRSGSAENAVGVA